MSIKAESPKALAPVYAELAEITVADAAFRKADAAPFDASEDILGVDETLAHTASKNAAREVIFDALQTNRNVTQEEKFWEMSRTAALKEIGGTALGSFSSYFSGLNGEMAATDTESIYLPAGEDKVISTNTKLVTANKFYSHPIELLDVSLGIIDRRRRQDRLSIGPENYATALKFFANKYAELENPSKEVSLEEIQELVGDTLKGFVDVARRDEPNFVEMTNIYTAIRTLPKGAVDQAFTRPLLAQSLRSLPEYGNETITTLFGALPKLDLSEDGEAAAQLVNLALRKSKKFEKTNDFRVALRALEVLPQSETSELAVRSFLQYRNDLEMSLDIDGTDEATHRLRQIVEHVVADPELHVEIKGISERATRHASELCKRAFLEGGLTREQGEQIKQTFARIMNNYKAI